MSLLTRTLIALGIPIFIGAILLFAFARNCQTSFLASTPLCMPQSDPTDAIDTSNYDTEAVSLGSIVNKVVAIGAIVPRKEITIRSQVSGIISEIHVAPGDQVKRDDLLATIKVLADPIALSTATARVRLTGIELNQAWKDRETKRKLYLNKTIPKEQYLTLDYEYRLKRAEYVSESEQLELVRTGAGTDPAVASNTVRSTIDGTVLKLPLKEGESVVKTNDFDSGSIVATVADMTDMVFEGTVDESEAGRINEGMSLQIKVGSIRDMEFDGLLEFVAPSALNEAGSVRFSIRSSIFAPKHVNLRSGYSASADIILDKRDNILTFDERALFFTGNRPFVYAASRGNQDINTGETEQPYARREISVGLSDGIRIEVLDGLSDGDLLIVPER